MIWVSSNIIGPFGGSPQLHWCHNKDIEMRNVCLKKKKGKNPAVFFNGFVAVW